MIRRGQHVKDKVTGTTGKVIDIFTKIGGTRLPKPLVLVRLDKPDVFGPVQSWYEHELEVTQDEKGATA
jgi:hypothetical protein